MRQPKDVICRNGKTLEEILKEHKLWLDSERKEGTKANLRGANLSGANLSGANLSKANLRGADMSEADLSGVDLSEANLSEANLREANLSGADLRKADLSMANLREADLSGVDLSRANLIMADLIMVDLSMATLDYSAWPLWCSSLGVKADEALVGQLAYHLLDLAESSGVAVLSLEELYKLANTSRVVKIHKKPMKIIKETHHVS